MLHKKWYNRPGGNTGRSLGAEPLEGGTRPLLSMLNLTLGEAFSTNSIPIKPAFQGVGGVPIGSIQCHDEVDNHRSAIDWLATPRSKRGNLLRSLARDFVQKGITGTDAKL